MKMLHGYFSCSLQDVSRPRSGEGQKAVRVWSRIWEALEEFCAFRALKAVHPTPEDCDKNLSRATLNPKP